VESSFEEAEALLQCFLEEQGFGSKLNWLFSEDVIIASHGNVFVRTPIPAGNRDRAKQCFELGKQRDLGMAFCAFASLDGVPCAYISLPKDELDAQYKMMDNRQLKYGYTTPLAEAKVTPSGFLWKLRQLALKYKQVVRWDEEVPSRETLLPVGF